MFGIGSKREMRELRNQTEGMFLSDVIKTYASPSLLNRKHTPFDALAVKEIKEKIEESGIPPSDAQHEKLMEICENYGDAEDFALMYFAFIYCRSLRGVSIELLSEWKLGKKSDFARYFFEEWIKNTPNGLYFPILFLPNCGGRVEDFRLPHEARKVLIDEFFKKISKREDFIKFVDSYVEQNQYWKHYPIE